MIVDDVSVGDEIALTPSKHVVHALANDLEATIRAGVRASIEGDAPGGGLVGAVLAGTQPGGPARLLRSVLCATELDLASAFDTAPFELFVDPSAAAIAGLQRPPVASPDLLPSDVPVRAEVDRRVETALQKARGLEPGVVLAARLVDDEEDAFSAARCGLLDGTVARMDAGATPNDALAGALRERLAGEEAPRAAYARRLLEAAGDAGPERSAYIDDLRARFAAKAAALATEEGHAELRARVASRLALATEVTR
jgi:hypothetical protein